MSKHYIQVEGHPDLVRDSSTGAIIRKGGASERDSFRFRNRRILDTEQRISNLENRVEDIAKSLNTITDLLTALVQKNG